MISNINKKRNMKKGKISITAENIFPILKKFLYSDQDIFLRELIANAIDATTKIKTISSKGDYDGDLGDLTLEIIIDKEAKTLTIRDKGLGMTEEEVKKYLNQMAFSSAEAFLEKYKDDANIIGHFGLGFYSAFMVSDQVEVNTLSYQEGAKPVKWLCDGDPEFSIGKAEKTTRGTDIILHVDEDSLEFLEEDRIAKILDTHCKFLPVPIKFGTKEEISYEGEGDDKKEIKTTVDNIINNTHPAWIKAPNKMKDEDYINFYKELYPMSPAPLFWIHLNIDFPFNLTGILYFPKMDNNVQLQPNKIHLYSNQVFVTDDVKDIVPEFLTLLHGVIDSPDIPLNVSRSYLQSDANVKKISSYITKKVADKLANLFKKDRPAFENKWVDTSIFVKYGMITNDKFYDKAVKYVLLKSIDGKHSTVEEYIASVKEIQTDKHDKTVIIYTNNEKEHYSYIQSAKEKGYDVIILETMIDNHFMQQLESKMGEITFVRVDSDIADNLVQKDEEKESVLSEKELEKAKNIFESAVPEDKKSYLSFKAMSPTDMPVIITKPEFMRRMQEMQAMQGGGPMGAFPDMYNIIINSNHPLVATKLMKMKSQEKKDKFAKHLYELALLNQNMLKGENLSSFIKDSIDFLEN